MNMPFNVRPTMVPIITRFLNLFLTILVLYASVTDRAIGATIRIDNSWNIWLEGEIVSGDYDKLIKLIGNNPVKSHGAILNLDSDGGDIMEATKIAYLIRDLYIPVFVETKCASACFFIYVGSPSRFAARGTLGIHRPYFNKSEFSNLAPNQAKQRYKALSDSVRTFLKKNDVPTAFVEKMFSLSSEEIYWLNDFDLKMLGERPPWFDQYMVSKCGFNSRKFLEVAQKGISGSESANNQLQEWQDCEAKILAAQWRANITKYLH